MRRFRSSSNYKANEILGIYEDEKISTSLTNHFEIYFPDEKTIFPSQNPWNWH
jgi:predicted acetyltransferase